MASRPAMLASGAMLLGIAVGLAACATSHPVRCEQKRPAVCTKEFKPVCATRDNGVRCLTTPCDSTERATYANACLACADASVYYFEPGQCD